MSCNLHKNKVCDLHKSITDPKDTDSSSLGGKAKWVNTGKELKNVNGIQSWAQGDKIHHYHVDGGGKQKKVNKCPTCNTFQYEDHKHSDLKKSEEGQHSPNSVENDPCPYCADSEDNRTDDCQYCQELDAQENANGTAGTDDCPMCQELDGKADEGIDDCPYCQTENITEEQANPEQESSHECNCPNCPEKSPADENMHSPEDCPECQEMYSSAVEEEPGQTGQGDPNLQGHETAEEVLDLLDQEPGAGGESPVVEAQKIDNTELPQGDEMKDNVSVTEDFGPAQKNNVPDSDNELNGKDSEESPDLSGVLQSGLDEHASSIQREKVLQMVSQTLQGFKANKQALEASKEQNQGLYNSCIQMLKSMIELCKLLGLEPKMSEEAPPQAPTNEAPPAAPQEDAPDPKAEGRQVSPQQVN